MLRSLVGSEMCIRDRSYISLEVYTNFGILPTFLLLDPIFASIRVWFALFLVSDPGCSSLLALCQPFPFSTGLARDFSPLELRLFLLSAPDSNLFDDSSHIFQHCFIPFSHLSGILIIVKRKSPLTQFLFHNMAGKYPTSYRLLLLFIK